MSTMTAPAVQPRWQGVIPFRGLEALHVSW